MGRNSVITSYSIHYTKLYDAVRLSTKRRQNASEWLKNMGSVPNMVGQKTERDSMPCLFGQISDDIFVNKDSIFLDNSYDG